MINEQQFKLKKDGAPYKNCFCRTPGLIENYEEAIKDAAQVWECHHRLETHNSDGERRPVDLKMEELIALGVYYDRPPEELIFLTPLDHNILHKKGKLLSEETRKKLSEAHRGHYVSEEQKRKISEANKGKKRSEETRKRISGGHKGKPGPNKGKPRSEETKAKISATLKSKHWKMTEEQVLGTL